MTTRVDAFDERVDSLFEPLRSNAVANRVFYTASTIGDFALMWHIIGVGRGLIDSTRWGDAARLSGALGIESILVNQGIKRLFRRARPVHNGDRPLHLRTPLTSSFPSGHASSAFCAAVILTGQQPSWWPLWYLLAIVVAASRIHVRIHHASDVAGGVLVGTALGLLAVQILS